jgi:hypothetical protein
MFKKYYQSFVVMWQHMFSVPVMRTVWRRELDLMKCSFIKISLLLESSHTKEQVRPSMTGKFSKKYFVQFTLSLLLGLNKQNFQHQNVFVVFR